MNNVRNNKDFAIDNLLTGARYALTAGKQKFIFYVISLLKEDPKVIDERLVFQVRELAEILEIEPKHVYAQFKSIVDNLMRDVLFIKNKLKDTGETVIDTFQWVSFARYYPSRGKVELQMSEDIKPYLVDLTSRFTMLNLSYIISFKSIYTIRIYTFCEQNKYLKKIRYELKDLRWMLGLEKGEYKLYADFKKRVLIPAVNEINKKTNITLSYREIKEGRKVVAIEFYIIEKEVKAEPDTDKVVDVSEVEEKTSNSDQEKIELLLSVGISKEQSRNLASRYTLTRIKEVIEYSHKPNIQNKTGAIIKALEQEWDVKKTTQEQKQTAQEYVQKQLSAGGYGFSVHRSDFCSEEEFVKAVLLLKKANVNPKILEPENLAIFEKLKDLVEI